MTTCTFCRVLSGELPSSRIYEDEYILAFLDIHPINSGHTLVIPRRHVQSFTDLSKEELEAITRVGQLIAAHLKATLHDCEGISLSLADGVSAGQEVLHVHLHVIPRRSGDGFGWKFPQGSGEAEEKARLDQVASLVRQSLERLKS